MNDALMPPYSWVTDEIREWGTDTDPEASC